MGRRDRWRLLAVAAAVVVVAGALPGAMAAQEPEATGILRALDAYMGRWRSEDKTGPQEETFHFEIELRWMDPGRTIARLHITRV